MQEVWVWSLGWEDPLEKEMATHPSILAWRGPWTEEPGGLQSMGSQSRTQLRDWARKHETYTTVTFLNQLTIKKNHLREVRKPWHVLVRMAAIKKSTNNKCWRGCGEKGTPLHCWWECKLVQPLWRTVWRFLKKLEIELPYSNPTYTPREPELKETCVPQCSPQHCL